MFILHCREPVFGVQFIHHSLQRKIRKTYIHKPFRITNLDIQGDDRDHITRRDHLGELCVRLNPVHHGTDVDHIFPRFPHKLHTDHHDLLKDRHLDLRELPRSLQRNSLPSKHPVNDRKAQIGSKFHDNIAGKRLKINDSQNNGIGKCIGKFRKGNRLGTGHADLHIFPKIYRKIRREKPSVMFIYDLQGSEMFL